MTLAKQLTIYVVILLVTGCASLPENISKESSYALSDTDKTQLGKAIKSILKNKPSKTGILPLSSGLDAFSSRYVLTTKADKSIDVQYYIWHYIIS